MWDKILINMIISMANENNVWHEMNFFTYSNIWGGTNKLLGTVVNGNYVTVCFL